MAMASWMFRGRTSRTGRTLRSRHDSEDEVQLDLTKDTAENAKELLLNIARKQGLTEGKRFGYLNAFVKLAKAKGAGELGYTVDQLLCCLRVAVAHDASQVRAAALRAVRYLLKEESDVKSLHSLQYSYLIARSFDVNLQNDAERMQALRLIRRMLVLAPSTFPPSLVRSLVALANGAAEEKDRMLRVCLAALSEICVLNTEVFISCGGVTAVQRNLLECTMPRIAESLCGVLLYLLNNPVTRAKAGVRLQSLAAPFCDIHWDPSRNREEREVRFHCSRLALLSVLRSWPGALHFCHPGDTSGLRAIVDILYVRHLDIRKAILDLLYELLGLPQPEWTDEISVALEAVNPSHPREAWRLGEGFVAAEGRSILPHLAKCRPNLVEMHLAFLLFTFLEVGLLGAIAEVIVTADTFIAVRATVLLGELLHLIHLLLPPDCCNLTPPLPSLLDSAATGTDPAAQNQALAAIAALSRLHAMLKRQPVPASLFLDQLLQGGAWSVRARGGGLPAVTITDDMGLSAGSSSRSKRERSRLYQLVLKDNDDILRDSMVLSNKDGFSWNWSIVRAILKSRNEALRRLEDSNYKTFMRRLVQYYKPSSNRFSRVEVCTKRPMNIYTLAGFEFLDCLLEADETEGQKLMSEFLADLWLQLDAITSSRSAHECLFSPQHITNSLCQDYFLFIGRLSRTARGLRQLDKAGILQQLLNLVVATNHDCYVKLVVAGLDYTLDAMPRVILGKVLTAGVELARLYATRHMLALLRARLPDFHKWGIELLVMQLYDSSRSVSTAALNILSEAVEDKACLDTLVGMRPSLLHLGDKGLLLLTCFLSTTTGFSYLNDAGFVATQLERWASSFNCRYVRIVEGELHDSLTLHQRGEDGRYRQRVTSARHYVKDVLVPPHLYGQLVQHSAGLEMLKQDPHLPKVIQMVRESQCDKEDDVLELKAALWAVGHVGTADAGVTLLEQADVLGSVVRLAEGCTEYAVKATAFYVLGLLATTHAGATVLNTFGWLSVRHDRHEQWPIIEEQASSDEGFPPANTEMEDSVSLSSGGRGDGTAGSELWDLEPGGDGPERRTFYLPGDDESGNEDEGMLLDETNLTAHWTTEQGPSPSVNVPRTAQQRKSATLPHWRTGMPQPRHTRSLSESKQVPPQILFGTDSLPAGNWIPPSVPRVSNREPVTAGNTLAPNRQDEGKSRSNSCTDSSGVSSCDSGPGRHPTLERVPPTLSPIPSSASLHTLQSARRASQISQRKLSVSTHGSVTSDTSSPSETILGMGSASRMSHQDLMGYATLKSLHRHRRPLLSDSGSALGESILAFDDSFPLSTSVAGSGSPGASSRILKARSLDRNFSQPVLSEFDSSLSGSFSDRVPMEGLYAANRLPVTGARKNELGHPCYMGICLPRQLMALYPSGGARLPAVPTRRRGSASFSELEQLPEARQEVDPSSSSDSDEEDVRPSGLAQQGMQGEGRLHSASSCLLCCRMERDRKISTSSSHRHRTDTESSQGGIESPVLGPPRRHKSQSFSSGGADTLAGNTPTESVDSSTSYSTAGNQVEETQHMPSSRLLRRDILKHVGRMSNPVWAKLSKQALLQLKQKYPSAFQDVCLYSAVSHKLASCTYRLIARRFIQELFLDLNFEVFYEEAVKILQSQQPALSALSAEAQAPSTVSFTPGSPKTSATFIAPDGGIAAGPAPSTTVSALSIKLASVVTLSPGKILETTSGEGISIVSPSGDVTFLNGVKGASDGASVTGRPSGSEPVPIAAPAKTVSIPAAYMMRSPPLEVVKEEPAASVSSSEQQSPVDSSSIISNGQVEEENVAFLNQKFDDIPMIDEGHTTTDTASKKQGRREEEIVMAGKGSSGAIPRTKTGKPNSAARSKVKNDVLVGNDTPNQLESSDQASSRGVVGLLNRKAEKATAPYVPDDLLAKSSSSGLSKEIKNASESQGNYALTSSGKVSAAHGVAQSAVLNSPHIGAKSQGRGAGGPKVYPPHPSIPSPTSARQRKIAITAAPDVISLQELSSPAPKTTCPNVPSNAHTTSKQKR